MLAAERGGCAALLPELESEPFTEPGALRGFGGFLAPSPLLPLHKEADNALAAEAPCLGQKK